MQIDINPSLIEKMRILFGILEEAHTQMGDTTYPDIYFDTQDTGESNSDPVAFDTLNQDTLTLALEIKKSLRL